MSAALKIPLSVTLSQLADMKASDALDLTGKSLPCTVHAVNGRIVTVNFEVQDIFTFPLVKMPIAEWAYMMAPVQVGDKGVALAADAYLGGLSGLGGGTANLSQKANLSTLVFVPFSNVANTTPDGNSVVLTGVSSGGVTLRSGDLNVSIVLTASGITMNLNGGNVTILNGDLIVGTTTFLTHKHSEVQTGGGESGPPVVGS